MTPQLDPVLPHNRAAYERLVRWKQRFAVGWVLLAAATMVLAPADYGQWLVFLSFGGLAATFGLIEWRRYQIRAKDLRERQFRPGEGQEE